jgi:hypothetical protein
LGLSPLPEQTYHNVDAINQCDKLLLSGGADFHAPISLEKTEVSLKWLVQRIGWHN